jgi:Uma2 family endonuclease
MLMATVKTARRPASTLADLLQQLGGISAARVRLRPSPGTATERDVLAMHDRENRLCELVDGALVEKVMGYLEAIVAVELIKLLGVHVDRHDLGIVAGSDGMLRLAAGLVRLPDVSFVSWSRLPGRRVPRQPIPELAPDLAVEVISRGNTKGEMARKVDEYFAAGVRLVWFVYHAIKSIEVYTAPHQSRRLGPKDTLDGGKVLPGLKLPIQTLFARLTR